MSTFYEKDVNYWTVTVSDKGLTTIDFMEAEKFKDLTTEDLNDLEYLLVLAKGAAQLATYKAETADA